MASVRRGPYTDLPCRRLLASVAALWWAALFRRSYEYHCTVANERDLPVFPFPIQRRETKMNMTNN